MDSRKLVGIPLANNGTTTTGTNVEIDMPSPASCSGDEIRPWALKWYRDKLYVGMVCSGEVTQDVNNLIGYVYSYTPGDANLSSGPCIEFPFDYNRGTSSYPVDAEWNPWKTVWNAANPIDSAGHFNSNWQGSYPSPIISDIEFDKGDMVIGVMDRFPDQFRSGPDPSGTITGNPANSYSVHCVPSGDLLKAGYSGSGTWSLESDGTVVSDCQGTYSTSGSNIEQGPDGMEFYHYDYYSSHQEITLGGLTHLPGRHEVITGAFDPTILHKEGTGLSRWGSGGLIWFDNQNGDYSKGWEGYYNNPVSGNFGKGNGFGDIEPICTESPGLEIGNLLWEDDNNNGSQDAGEAGLAGVALSLYDAVGTLLATTTTDGNGNYSFSNDSNTDQNWVSGTKVEENMTYYIVFGSGQYTSNELTVSGLKYDLAAADQTSSSSNQDFVDSDASEGIGTDPSWVMNMPFVQLSTSSAGANMHTVDVGFEPQSILPVELVDINLKGVDCSLILTWEIGDSYNFDHFEVQQAGSDAQFVSIRNIQAKTTGNQYGYAFSNDANSINYVRLKMVDNNGTVSYSEIMNVVDRCGNNIEWGIYPNPTKRGVGIRISHSKNSGQQWLTIVSTLGKVVYNSMLENSQNEINIPTEDMISGLYQVILENSNGYRSTKKLVITK